MDESYIPILLSREFIKLEDDCTCNNSYNFSPDGSKIITCSDYSEIKIWDCFTGECINTFTSEDDYNCSDISKDGLFIVVGCQDKTIKILCMSTGRCIKTLTDTDSVYQILFLPNGNIFSVSSDKVVKIWCANTGLCIKTLIATDVVSVMAHISNIISSPDASKISYYCYSSGLVRLYSTTTSKYIDLSGTNVRQFSPDSLSIAFGRIDGNIRIFCTETGNYIKTLIGHEQAIISCNYSPDGSQIVSCTNDGEIKIWDVKTGSCIKTLMGSFYTHSCKFSPDGLRIASCHPFIKVWDFPLGLK